MFVSAGPVGPDAFEDMIVGGVISENQLDQHIVPNLVQYLNLKVLEDPDSTTSQFVLTMVDGKCSSEIDGCEDVINGEGDCAPWDGLDTTPVLTTTEVLCNPIVASGLVLDQDMDLDGINDAMSMGVRISGIHITIDN